MLPLEEYPLMTGICCCESLTYMCMSAPSADLHDIVTSSVQNCFVVFVIGECHLSPYCCHGSTREQEKREQFHLSSDPAD